MKDTNCRIVYIIKIIIMVLYPLVFMTPKTHAAENIKITVEGVKDEIRKNVFLSLSIERHKNDPTLTPDMIKNFNENAADEIRKALQPFGFYNPDIHSDLKFEKNVWRAYYIIAQGKPVIISEMDLTIEGEGANNTLFKKLLKDFPLKKGEVFESNKYENAKHDFLVTALETGFIRAKITIGKVEVYPEKMNAKMILHLDTGRQYYFGEIKFIQDTFRESFLPGFVPFKKGDPYSVSGLLKLQSALNNSDYFEAVEITPIPDDLKGNEVPITIQLTLRKPNKFTFGFGFGTDTGIRGVAGWENRLINDAGHKFKIVLNLSQITSDFKGEYLIPFKKNNLIFNAEWQKENTITSKSEKSSTGARYNYLNRVWNESIYMNFEHEIFKAGRDSGISNLLIPGINWTRVIADNPMAVRRGIKFFFDARGANKALLSSASFFQLRASLKYIQGITPLSRIVLRTEGGRSFTNNFSELPASLRFFAGGDNSVRGYGYNTIGPKDENGDVIGGRYLVTGSIEFERVIKGNISGTVFYDIGNAINSLREPLKTSAGFGIHWGSPVGPIRVDIAFPLNEEVKSWRVHFIMGMDL